MTERICCPLCNCDVALSLFPVVRQVSEVMFSSLCFEACKRALASSHPDLQPLSNACPEGNAVLDAGSRGDVLWRASDPTQLPVRLRPRYETGGVSLVEVARERGLTPVYWARLVALRLKGNCGTRGLGNRLAGCHLLPVLPFDSVTK